MLQRRRFLAGAGAIGLSVPLHAATQRPEHVMLLRKRLADKAMDGPSTKQQTNGDRELYPNHLALFSKGLPHLQNGEVEPTALQTLLRAVDSGSASDFAAIARGSGRTLVNPRGGLAYALEGGDPQQFRMPPPPAFASAEAAAEMVELYWMALLRDVPFDLYESHPLVAKACSDLNRLEEYRAPGARGGITPANLFRADLPGVVEGPYTSQFLLRPVPHGSGYLDQRQRTPLPENVFLNTQAEWLQLQAGVPPWRLYHFDPVARYIRNGRDLGEWVHFDYLHQAFLNAALTLVDMGPDKVLNMNQYWNEANPYKHSKAEYGFVTFGMAEAVDWVCRVTTCALKAAWYQKWMCHLRLRPEAFGGRVFMTRGGSARYPIHAQLLNAAALEETDKIFSTTLLPQAYPEGSPLHPAYPGGHGTVAGACTTVLKALFDETQPVPDVVVPYEDGTLLMPRPDLGLTVGGELNKLAVNVALGRSFGGIHYRSDGIEGILFGERVAIRLLQDLVETLPEEFGGYSFTSFQGERVMISKTGR
jgi:hypothetical protein